MQKLLSQDPVKIVLSLAVTLAVIIVCASTLAAQNVTVAATLSGLFLAIGFAFFRKDGVVREVGAATALIGQAIALTAAFQGHAWQTSQAMDAIRSESNEISQIVKVIDEIAFQTNLLALNAGVEAARAGEAGRGFAVVASEVRALAQRSSDSATTIRGLIERSGDQVQAGSTKIEETVAALSSVITDVIEITSKTEKITDGARQQTTAISDLNQKVSDLDVTTQQNAAMFEETSAACSNLESTASFLRDLTRQFQVSASCRKQSAAA